MKRIEIRDFVVIIIFIIYGISVFGMLGKGLVWNDEGLTVMYAKRVLDFGVPKIDDGKNIINAIEFTEDKSFCTQPKIKANLCNGWTQYYVGAVGVEMAEFVDNIFIKTFLLRLPFALLGFAGSIIFLYTILQFIDKKWHFEATVLFLTLELLSVYFVLVITQARHYAITVFLGSLIIYLYSRFRLLNRGGYVYYVLIPVLLLLQFMNFVPVFVVEVISIVTYEVALFFISKNKKVVEHVKALAPIFTAAVVALMVSGFFKIFEISKAKMTAFSRSLYGMNSINAQVVLNHLVAIMEFLTKREYFLVFIINKIFVFYLLYGQNKKKIKNQKLIKFSFLLTVLLVINIFIIARMPVLFMRYAIFSQPLLISSIVVDYFVVFSFIKVKQENIKAFRIFVISVICLFSVYKISNIYGHVYEIGHKYEGPVDYIVNYIHDKYGNTENLIIATNYEEAALMYYLKSKVIVGYVGNNIEVDSKLVPDVVIMRKNRPNFVGVLEGYLENEKYEYVDLPIFDYPYNNISELTLVYPHLFKTKYATNNNEMLRIYTKLEE